MTNAFYLVKKSQWQILADDDTWMDFRNPSNINKNPKVFASVDDARDAEKKMKESNKIGIYNEDTFKKVFGVFLEAFCIKNSYDISMQDTPSIQENASDELLDEEQVDEQYTSSENDGLSANIKKTVDTPLITDFEDLLERMIALFDRLASAKEALPGELVHSNQTLQDELHFSEFEQLNVVEGYQAWRRIHDARVERRRIKNEMEVVKMAEDLFDGFETSDLQTVLNRIDAIRHRKYNPRTDHYPNRQKLSENREESDAS